MKLIKALLFLALFPVCNLLGQTGNKISVSDNYQILWKCVDSVGTKIPFYELWRYRTGFASEMIQRFRANGNTFVLPAGEVTTGFCATAAGGGASPDTLRDMEVLQMCDINSRTATSFLRLIQRNTLQTSGAGVNVIVANLTLAGASYTPTGTITDGPCVSESLIQPNRGLYTGIASFNSNYTAWAVNNFGDQIGTLTMNSQIINLYPGQRVFCYQTTDDVLKKSEPCRSFSIDATNTYFQVITKVH